MSKKENKEKETKDVEETTGEEVNPIDALLDPKNSDNIVLFSAENDEPISFEQIALIPIKKKVYVILKPIDELEDVEEDQGVAFEIVEEDDELTLNLVEDEDLIQSIFDEYMRLGEETQTDKD